VAISKSKMPAEVRVSLFEVPVLVAGDIRYSSCDVLQPFRKETYEVFNGMCESFFYD